VPEFVLSLLYSLVGIFNPHGHIWLSTSFFPDKINRHLPRWGIWSLLFLNLEWHKQVR